MATQSRIAKDRPPKESESKKLPLKTLMQCFLFSSPQDAVKWLLVSKEVKKFIEENRDKMRRFNDIDFIIGGNIILHNAHESPLNRRILRIHYSESSKDSSALLEFDHLDGSKIYNACNGEGGEYWTLNDSSNAGKKKLIHRIVDWFHIRQVLLEMKSPEEVELLRPFVADDTSICIQKWRDYTCDDTVMDAVEHLRVQNLKLSDYKWTESAMDRLESVEFKTVHLGFCCQALLPRIRSDTIFYEGSLTYLEFEDLVVVPWYDGDLPHLKVFRFEGRGYFPWYHRFERIHYVSTVEERAENKGFIVRAYVLEDRSGFHLMELKLVFIQNAPPCQPSEYFYVFVNIVH